MASLVWSKVQEKESLSPEVVVLAFNPALRRQRYVRQTLTSLSVSCLTSVQWSWSVSWELHQLGCISVWQAVQWNGVCGSSVHGIRRQFNLTVLQIQAEERISKTQVKTEWARVWEGARRLEHIAKRNMKPSRVIHRGSERSQIESVSLESEPEELSWQASQRSERSKKGWTFSAVNLRGWKHFRPR